MALLSNVINVQLLAEGQLAQRDNVNTIGLFTPQLGTLNSANRTKVYASLGEVETDFGTTSATYDFAKAFFAQSPNPVTAGGYLAICYHRSASETVAATAAVLTGAQISEAAVIPQLQAISDGSFVITIDGVADTVTALDFRTVSTLAEVAALIDAQITGTVAVVDGRIVITSSTTGATSAITLLSAHTSGTFIGDILAISSGSGAVAVQGAASATLTVETKETAVIEALKEVFFVGFGFIDNPTDEETTALATFAQANDKIYYDVFSMAANLEKNVTNVVWSTKLSSLTSCRMLFSKANNRKLWIAYASRTHVVNFGAENTAMTMNLKELKGIVAEDYTQDEISKAYTVGLDVYTTIKNVPAVLCSPANDFVDNVYNLIAYVDAVKTDAFNLLKGTATKIPQTTKGVNQLIDTIEKTTRGYVRAGVFAPGTWSSPDSFGDIDTFKRSIEMQGFYVLAGLLADQPQADRTARKSPVIQVAVKNAGAIHKADIIINFNL